MNTLFSQRFDHLVIFIFSVLEKARFNNEGTVLTYLFDSLLSSGMLQKAKVTAMQLINRAERSDSHFLLVSQWGGGVARHLVKLYHLVKLRNNVQCNRLQLSSGVLGANA